MTTVSILISNAVMSSAFGVSDLFSLPIDYLEADDASLSCKRRHKLSHVSINC
jgi:hypothetical protein